MTLLDKFFAQINRNNNVKYKLYCFLMIGGINHAENARLWYRKRASSAVLNYALTMPKTRVYSTNMQGHNTRIAGSQYRNHGFIELKTRAQPYNITTVMRKPRYLPNPMQHVNLSDTVSLVPMYYEFTPTYSLDTVSTCYTVW